MSEFPVLPRANRTEHYQEQAAKLRQMAEAEQNGRLRSHMLRIADEYEKLAASLSVSRR
jgi:hypothetical protein